MRAAEKRVEYVAEVLAAFEKISFNDRKKLQELLRGTEVFILRVFGENSHYYQRFCSLEFVPQNIIYNTGHYKYREYWDGASNQFRSLLLSMRDELRVFGNPGGDGELPEKITLPWLFQNLSWQVWVSLVGLLAGAFVLGVKLSNVSFIKQLLG